MTNPKDLYIYSKSREHFLHFCCLCCKNEYPFNKISKSKKKKDKIVIVVTAKFSLALIGRFCRRRQEYFSTSFLSEFLSLLLIICVNVFYFDFVYMSSMNFELKNSTNSWLFETKHSFLITFWDKF